MLKINFIPEDYVLSSQIRRTNLISLVLFLLVMAVLGGSFVSIKVKQRVLDERERMVNEKMARTKQAIEQFEQLQEKRKAMMKTAWTIADLLESVPRSLLLASLTNNLPAGVSLHQLKLVQKKPKDLAAGQRVGVSTAVGGMADAVKYQAVQAQNSLGQKASPEKLLETHIDIEGVAGSDLQVAAYIERLTGSSLLDNVTLVESKEQKVKNVTLRQFKLRAMLSSTLLQKQEGG